MLERKYRGMWISGGLSVEVDGLLEREKGWKATSSC